MASTAATLIGQHSTNPIQETYHKSGSSKEWTRSYAPITNLIIHTIVQGPQAVQANFSAFHDEYDDDSLRLHEPAYPPNYKRCRLNSEEDGIQWFHTEVSNIVLAGFARYPELILASHEKSFSEHRRDHTVDVAYSVAHAGRRKHVAIGEFKRGLIVGDQWQSGTLRSSQESLSRELRAYAHIYACPQIFCFDNYAFLVLQFRAREPDKIKDPKCEVDCWVIPRENLYGCTLRYAFYRLLVQGFRRCQGETALDVALHEQRPFRREFYSGKPVWKIDGSSYYKPWNYQRVVHGPSGAFYWAHPGGSNPILDANGNTIWDTEAFWGDQEQQAEQDDGEDLYSAD
ncbi:Uncharacterized protein TPAR_03458 [Tolypocladium paradoxum]|uniref:Uncharacterized protein n=1 Tax=Tolypocladium paradoxum TaxID=94208 RepID=A0A2S4L1T9_9HYPO|nr:Uncharacterized protein TPAR_03458 [Tolypocladium paradoxum]